MRYRELFTVYPRTMKSRRRVCYYQTYDEEGQRTTAKSTGKTHARDARMYCMKLYNPLKPSGGPYPVLSKGERIWIDVSMSQQLVYIFHGTHVIYTMATSSGMQYIKGDGSPPGVYQIQAERGKWFYVPSEHVGAEYWVSWRGNGNYLFHSVPMTRNKKMMPYVAARLLHEASFGCFLLTIPDAKWIYDHVRYGTTVIVERAQVLLQGATIVDPSETQYIAAYLSGVPSTGAHE